MLFYYGISQILVISTSKKFHINKPKKEKKEKQNSHKQIATTGNLFGAYCGRLDSHQLFSNSRLGTACNVGTNKRMTCATMTISLPEAFHRSGKVPTLERLLDI